MELQAVGVDPLKSIAEYEDEQDSESNFGHDGDWENYGDTSAKEADKSSSASNHEDESEPESEPESDRDSDQTSAPPRRVYNPPAFREDPYVDVQPPLAGSKEEVLEYLNSAELRDELNSVGGAYEPLPEDKGVSRYLAIRDRLTMRLSERYPEMIRM
jgi:hypothetical protein